MSLRLSRIIAANTGGRRDGRSRALATDLRFELFAAVFALSTIGHTLQMLLEQQVVGPIDEYLERWRQVLPTIHWPSAAGLTIAGAMLVLSLLILVLPYRRLLLALLAVPALAWNLTSPERIPAHNSVMAAALGLVALLALGEILDRWCHRQSHAPPSVQWYTWTLSGLKALCALTYLFSFVQKLNPDWFGSRAPSTTDFLYQPIEPLITWLGLRPRLVRQLLAPVAVYGTVLLEAVLPLLLFWRRTQLWGCLLGLLLHLPMLAHGVGDFPIMLLAFYPLFLSPEKARELFWRCTRPRRSLELAIRAVLTVLGAFTILRAYSGLPYIVDAAVATPMLFWTYWLMMSLAWALFIQAGLALIEMLVQTRSANPEAPPREQRAPGDTTVTTASS